MKSLFRVFLRIFLVASLAVVLVACGGEGAPNAVVVESSSSVAAVPMSSEPAAPALSSSSSLYGQLLDPRDNQVYKTVVINGQTWMAQNLNFNTNHVDSRGVQVVNSWCGGGKDETAIEGDCDIYGRLYLWSAAMDSAGYATPNGVGMGCGYESEKKCYNIGVVQGVCPSGWHLPSDGEYRKLVEFAGGEKSGGVALKSTSSLWDNISELTNGKDLYGFAALPAGGWDGDFGTFAGVGLNACFWSSYDDLVLGSSYLDISFLVEGAYVVGLKKNFAMSVRCVKD